MDKDMLSNRSLINISALSLAVVLLMWIASAMPAHAQQATENNSTDGGSLSLPLFYILDSSMESQEQDIKEKIFEYKFDAAKSNPGEQSNLIKERSDDLKNVTDEKKDLLNTLKENNMISDDQRVGMADDMNASIEKIDGWSKKLEERAVGLAMVDDHSTYAESVMPLMKNISDAREMASEIVQEAKEKKDTGKNVNTPANPSANPASDASNKNNDKKNTDDPASSSSDNANGK